MVGRRVLALSVVLVALPACETEPDVVAVKSHAEPVESGALFNKGRIVNGCQEGYYFGSFSSWTGDGGVAALRGTVEFSLVQEPRKEFLVLTSSKLKGVSTEPAATFTADIVSTNGCVEGKISTRLENGSFELDALADLAGFPFSGEVTGEYLLPPQEEDGDAARVPASFSGLWIAGPVQGLADGGEEYTLRYSGSWGAMWTGENRRSSQ